MKSLQEALSIIWGSKQFEFDYGDNGSTVLVITSYYNGDTLRLDLGNIDDEILDALQVEAPDYTDDEDEYED